MTDHAEPLSAEEEAELRAWDPDGIDSTVLRLLATLDAARQSVPATEDEVADHDLHFDPDCEECAYLARPTRETLGVRVERTAPLDALRKAAQDALIVFDIADAEGYVGTEVLGTDLRRVTEALRAALPESPVSAPTREVDIPGAAAVLGLTEEQVRNLMDAGVLTPIDAPEPTDG